MNFSGEDFSEFLEDALDTVSGETEKPNKGGRPTIADNCLLGSRNQWRAFFEQCWPEIGWPLLQIRKRRSSIIKDVQRVFESVRGKPHCDMVTAFLQGSPLKPVNAPELCKNRIASNKLRYELQEMQRKHPELQRACLEAQDALKQADEINKKTIEAEFTRRSELLKEHDETLIMKQRECISLEAKVRDQETYWYCSELLDFLRGGRRALTPLNLANALAGLPYMRWRQSETRCSRMPADSYAQHPYAVFQLIERLFRRIGGKRGESLTDEFRAELLKLPKSERYPRDSICEQWRDFRLAIEEVSKSRHQSGFIPYAITSAFLKNVSRQKTSVDNVLDVQERLTLKAK